jgi:two-component system sensor histidine kinase PilS (NtrC family)
MDRIGGAAPKLTEALRRSLADRIRTARSDAIVTTASRSFPVGVTTTYTEGDSQRTDPTATAIFQDISDIRRLEVLRLRAERLEGVAELSASLAHEIKNPLASIRSAVEQLGEMPQATADGRTLSDLVMRESDRLSRLLTEFLDFARVRVTRTGRVDLAAIVLGAARLAEEHPDRREGVHLKCDMADGAPFVVDGDEDLLHRAVFNLALNAVQASPPATTVTLELTSIAPDQLPLGLRFENGSISLRVSDEGAGIPVELRDRLFDPFFTTKPGGSGLGLAVVHRAIEAHRGMVLLDSGSSGTTFTVILPRAGNTTGGHA